MVNSTGPAHPLPLTVTHNPSEVPAVRSQLRAISSQIPSQASLISGIYPANTVLRSCLTFCVGLISNPFTIVPAVLRGYNDCFSDGDHIWKQVKYKLGLTCVRDAYSADRLKRMQAQLEACRDPTDLQKSMQKLVSFLLSIGEKPVDSWRMEYRKNQKLLREILDMHEFETEVGKALVGDEYDPLVKDILDICFLRFTEVHIYSFLENLVEMMLKSGADILLREKYITEKPADIFTLPLELQFAAIDAAPQELKAPLAALMVDRAKGFFNISFDPHSGSNMPYVVGDLLIQQKAGEKIVRILRSGTPTKQREILTFSSEAQVISEFKYFNAALALKGKSILFVSLQDMVSEGERIEAIKGLHRLYPKSFHFIVLSHDTPFYHQTGEEYAVEKMDSSDFIAKFLNQMFIPGRGYFFPESYTADSNFREDIKQILEQVLEDLYENKPALSVDERKDFITFAYQRIILYLLTNGCFDYFLACCTHSADRAGMVNSLLSYLCAKWSEQENCQEVKRSCDVNTHAPALVVRKQSMNARRERLLSLLRRLDDPGVSARFHKRKQEVGVLSHIQVSCLQDQQLEESASASTSNNYRMGECNILG